MTRLVAGVAALAMLTLSTSAAAQGPGPLSGLHWSQRYARPGENLWATYRSSEQVTVSFAIRDAAGHVVRDLGDGVPEAAGTHAVDWEGYAGNARRLRDGTYRLVLTATDASGQVTVSSAPITLDTRRPEVSFATRYLATARSPVVIRMHDSQSGIGSAVLIIGGHVVASSAPGATRLAYRPRRGWKPGRLYGMTVYVRDRAGNARSVSEEYVAPRRG